MTPALLQLAKDVIEANVCRCYVDDLTTGEECPCAGDGRDDKAKPTWDGCLHCQAQSAVAEHEAAEAQFADGPPLPTFFVYSDDTCDGCGRVGGIVGIGGTMGYCLRCLHGAATELRRQTSS